MRESHGPKLAHAECRQRVGSPKSACVVCAHPSNMHIHIHIHMSHVHAQLHVCRGLVELLSTMCCVRVGQWDSGTVARSKV